MTDIDLTQAVEAIQLSPEVSDAWGDEDFLYAMSKAVAAAVLPYIERQVREQVAREIAAKVIPVTSAHSQTQTAHNRALEYAASIARGDSR